VGQNIPGITNNMEIVIFVYVWTELLLMAIFYNSLMIPRLKILSQLLLTTLLYIYLYQSIQIEDKGKQGGTILNMKQHGVGLQITWKRWRKVGQLGQLDQAAYKQPGTNYPIWQELYFNGVETRLGLPARKLGNLKNV